MSVSTNVARTSAELEKPTEYTPPSSLAVVFLPCPSSFTGSCRFVFRCWTCGNCRRMLTYGHDGWFYCACGRAPALTFSFQCACPRHLSDAFVNFADDDLNHFLQRMKSAREANILVLGETGVGKSTWINAIYNYLSFSSFEMAEVTRNALYAIPCTHSYTLGLKTTEVFVGSEEERAALECQKKGESVTQLTASYTFKYRDLSVRLIDTPGIGDTRGLEVDKSNFQNVLDYLSHFDELHGICILLKPGEARLTTQFKYCLKELFRQLHVDACKNIVFCITRSRASDYEPGTTLPILQQLIDEINLPIKLDNDTIYCIDDEAVLYLYGQKKGVSFPKTYRDLRKMSWDQSESETSRLIEHVLSLKPHQLKDTLSLNDTRRAIMTLCAGPLADLASLMETNIGILEEKKQRMISKQQQQQQHQNGEYQQESLIELDSYRHRPLPRPRIVCTSADCRPHKSRGQKAPPKSPAALTVWDAAMKQICCAGCQAPNISMCDSIQQSTGTCKICECHVSKHRWELYRIDRIGSRVIKSSTPLPTPRRNTVKMPKTIDELLRTVCRQRDEKRLMLEIAAKLAQFLRKYSVISHNDVFDEYLQQQLQNVGADDDGCEQAKALRRLQEDYSKQQKDLKTLLELSGPSGADFPLTTEDVRGLIRQLYELDICGSALQKAMEVASDAAAAAFVYQSDRVFQPNLFAVPGRNKVQAVFCSKRWAKVFED